MSANLPAEPMQAPASGPRWLSDNEIEPVVQKKNKKANGISVHLKPKSKKSEKKTEAKPASKALCTIEEVSDAG